MVFISNQYDVTLTPVGAGIGQALMSSDRNLSGKSFAEARAINAIYAGNGAVCQRQMCNSTVGCDDVTACSQFPVYKDILQFCGPIGTPGMYMDGAYWVLQPANEHQQLLAATEAATGMNPLPTPYNTVGMY